MATHSHIFAWEIPWSEETGRLQSMGLQRVKPDLVTSTSEKKHKFIVYSKVYSVLERFIPLIGEGNGNSLLPWKSHGRRSLLGCSPGCHEVSDTTERIHFHFSLTRIGEGNGNPLPCSCLKNPRDGRAWWAAIYGVGDDWGNLAAAADCIQCRFVLPSNFLNSLLIMYYPPAV